MSPERGEEARCVECSNFECECKCVATIATEHVARFEAEGPFFCDIAGWNCRDMSSLDRELEKFDLVLATFGRTKAVIAMDYVQASRFAANERDKQPSNMTVFEEFVRAGGRPEMFAKQRGQG